MSIFMEEYFEEEDYLANLPVIECADDPVTAMYRIAYEGEVNYKKIEEAAGIALQNVVVNEADIKEAAKAKFDVVVKTLKKCIEWVKTQFQKIIGAITRFINEKYDNAFDKLCQKAFNHMKANKSITLRKPVTAYNYNIDKAQANFERCVNASATLTKEPGADKDANDAKIKKAWTSAAGSTNISGSSDLSDVLRKSSRGEKRVEIKTVTDSQFQQAASTFRNSKNTVKKDYNELKKEYNSSIKELQKQVKKVQTHALKSGGKTEMDKKIINESNNLIACIREALKIIQVAKGNVMETISGSQNVVKALAHAALGSDAPKLKEPEQVKGNKGKGGNVSYKAINGKFVKHIDGKPVTDTTTGGGTSSTDMTSQNSSAIADIFGVALNESDEDDIFGNVDFI